MFVLNISKQENYFLQLAVLLDVVKNIFNYFVLNEKSFCHVFYFTSNLPNTEVLPHF